MSLATAAAVAGIASTAYGAYQSNRAMRDTRNAQNRALDQATTQLNPFSVAGLGGQQAFWTNGQLNFQGGNLDPTAAALSQYAAAGVPSFGGLPAEVQRALQSFGGTQGVPDLELNGLDQILGGTNQMFTQAQQGLTGVGGFDPRSLFGGAQTLAGQIPGAGQFQTGLQSTAFQGAQSQLAGLGQTYQDAYTNTLGTLREQARPEMDRAFAGLTDNLFATGRLGSTGGALQTEAFARGLGQADLSRQLAATQQAQQAQQNALGLGVGLTGVGTNLSQQGNLNMGALSSAAQSMFGTGDQLLNSAYNRFGQSAQLAADLNQARFARSMYGNDLQYNRAQNWLGTQVNMAGLPAALQGAQLGNVNAALQGQSGIQQQLLQLFGAGLSGEQAAANARVGSGSNMAQIVGSPSFGAPGQAMAGTWSQLGGALMNPNGIGGALGRIFGPSTPPIVAPDAWGALDDALRTGQVGG